MLWLFFLVSLSASVIGGICGVGGGVIIKPVLDAAGVMSVSSISFLSGCTVLSMSVISVLRNSRNRGMIDVRTSTPLAVGSVFGGIIGKSLFDILKFLLQNENHLGAVQAGLLLIVTLGALLYSVYSGRIRTCHVSSLAGCVLIGLALGAISSFLGIGGGPINLTVLFFFFSMDIKKAAANSLYIIMFSQLASLLQTLINGSVPPIRVLVLVFMVVAGVTGGIIGGHLNQKISEETVDRLFIGFMAVIIFINLYNIVKFTVLS